MDGLRLGAWGAAVVLEGCVEFGEFAEELWECRVGVGVFLSLSGGDRSEEEHLLRAQMEYLDE